MNSGPVRQVLNHRFRRQIRIKNVFLFLKILFFWEHLVHVAADQFVLTRLDLRRKSGLKLPVWFFRRFDCSFITRVFIFKVSVLDQFNYIWTQRICFLSDCLNQVRFVSVGRC